MITTHAPTTERHTSDEVFTPSQLNRQLKRARLHRASVGDTRLTDYSLQCFHPTRKKWITVVRGTQKDITAWIVENGPRQLEARLRYSVVSKSD